MKQFADSIIPDDQLQAYLADKLLVRPDYGFDTEMRGELTSRHVAARAADEKNRKENNGRANPKRK